ncbi:MAG: hypothetical protein HQL12_03040 [Candidatus Omnitrophica bacterium]|nr:hypothetical protein [Candidatus Omnitrophota bacterium]
METMTVQTDRRKEGQTRELIDFLLYITDAEYTRRYWLNALVRQGRLSESRAGKLLVIMGLV